MLCKSGKTFAHRTKRIKANAFLFFQSLKIERNGVFNLLDYLKNYLEENKITEFGITGLSDDLLLPGYKFKEETKYRNVIVILFPFLSEKLKENGGNLAKYARLHDYHSVISEFLGGLCGSLKERLGGNYKYFVDSSPLNEKLAGQKCGLGFIGKNGLLINKKYGSGFFIAEILTDIEILPYSAGNGGGCGSCNLCEKSCPSGALSENGFEMKKCLSFISQKKDGLTETEKKLIIKSGTVWGCDICSDVCPYSKNAGYTGFEPFLRIISPSLDLGGIMNSKEENPCFFRGKYPLLRNLNLIKTQGLDIGFAAAADKNELKKLFSESFDEPESVADFYASLEGRECMVYRINGEIISTVYILFVKMKTEKGLKEGAVLSGIATKKAHRNKKHMEILMGRVLEYLYEKKVEIVTLSTELPDFYKKYGFTSLTKELSFSAEPKAAPQISSDEKTAFSKPDRQDYPTTELCSLYDRFSEKYNLIVKRNFDDFLLKLKDYAACGYRLLILYRNNKPSAYAFFEVLAEKTDVIELVFTEKNDVFAVVGCLLSKYGKKAAGVLPCDFGSAEFFDEIKSVNSNLFLFTNKKYSVENGFGFDRY